VESQPTTAPVSPPKPPKPPPMRARRKAKKAPPRVFVPVELPEEEPLFDGRTLALGALLALMILPPVGWLFLTAVPDAPELLQQIVEFTIIEPPPPPEPEPEPEPTPPPKKVVKKVDMEKINKPIPTAVAAEEPAEEAKPVFGLTMDSTVEGSNSGFKMRVGNTLNIEPTDEIVPPEDIKPLRSVSFARLEVAPKLVRDFRAEYPEGPRSEGIEGTVVMKLTISETGKVTGVKIVRGVHPELDAAAKAAAFRFVYKPGTDGGEPVITTNFVHRYTWLIEG
jgi:TonB family protein